MAITKKDLQYEVDRLNNKYCKNTKHKLYVSQAYGGYQVNLTGKRRKDGKGFRGYLGSGATHITYGHDTARNTLKKLFEVDSRGYIKEKVNYYEKQKRYWK